MKTKLLLSIIFFSFIYTSKVSALDQSNLVEISQKDFSVIYPAVWFSPSTKEMVGLNKQKMKPPTSLYKIFIEPNDPEMLAREGEFSYLGTGKWVYDDASKSTKTNGRNTRSLSSGELWPTNVYKYTLKDKSWVFIITDLDKKANKLSFLWRELKPEALYTNRKIKSYIKLTKILETADALAFIDAYNLANIKVDFSPSKDAPPLIHVAMRLQRKDSLIFLLNNGANVNFISNNENLMQLILRKTRDINLDIAFRLLEQGFEPKIEAEQLFLDRKHEPLNFLITYAIAQGIDKSEELLILLLKKGMNPNIRSSDGSAAVHIAVYDNNIKLLKLLRKFNADMNLAIIPQSERAIKSSRVETKNNYTPLMLAAYRRQNESLRELISYNEVNQDLKSRDGKTALDIQNSRMRKK